MVAYMPRNIDTFVSEMEAAAAEHEAEAAKLRSAIAALKGSAVRTASTPDRRPASLPGETQKMIMDVFESAPDRLFDVHELLIELAQRGHQHGGLNATRAALNRLWKRGLIVRPRTGKYMLAPSEPTAESTREPNGPFLGVYADPESNDLVPATNGAGTAYADSPEGRWS